MTLSKSEAAALLHISESTLQRRMRAGKYTFTKTGEGQYAEVRFTHEGLGLAEPTPEPRPITSVAVAPEPAPDIGEPDAFAPRPLSREERDAEFAARFKAGLETDSAGNRADGTNERFITKGIQSLLGPVEPDHSPPPETQAHMLLELRHGDDGPAVGVTRHSFEHGEGFTRGGSPLCAGISQEQYDAMMRSYTKRFPRGQSEQEKANALAEENIRRSFPR